MNQPPRLIDEAWKAVRNRSVLKQGRSPRRYNDGQLSGRLYFDSHYHNTSYCLPISRRMCYYAHQDTQTTSVLLRKKCILSHYSRILCNFAVRDINAPSGWRLSTQTTTSQRTFSLSQMSRGWACSDYAMARKRTFKNVFVKQEGGRPSLFGAMPCKEEESEAKIRHIQYPKPNYKH